MRQAFALGFGFLLVTLAVFFGFHIGVDVGANGACNNDCLSYNYSGGKYFEGTCMCHDGRR